MTDSSRGYQQFFAELKRRRVFRVMAAYGIIGFGIIEAADAIFPRVALPDWAVTLVVWLTLLGFPIAVLLAWAFDSTPEGMKRTEDATPEEISEILAQPGSHRWIPGLLALAGVALLFGGWWMGQRGSGPDSDSVTTGTTPADVTLAFVDPSEDPRPSIAVLPFVNMSADEDQEYFSDGITEELLNTLAKIRELRVAGRTSAFKYKGENKDLREIGDELGVRYLIEGSVRKAGNRLRITAQLIDASVGSHLWSDQYDRDLDDVFAIQTEIAQAIAAQLRVPLGLDEGERLVSPTADLTAYDLYLAGRAMMRARGQSVFEAARLFEAAAARDSNWAPAWAGLAESLALRPYYGPGPDEAQVPPDSAYWARSLDAAEAAARRAIELDPNNASAMVALGNSLRDRWDWDPAEQAYIKALRLDPDNVEAHQQYAEFLAYVGRTSEALQAARRSLALDRSPIRLNVAGYIALEDARYEEAIGYMTEGMALDTDGNIPWLRGNLLAAYMSTGQWLAARDLTLRMTAEGAPDLQNRVRETWPARDEPPYDFDPDQFVGITIFHESPAAFWMALGQPERALTYLEVLREVPPFGFSNVLFNESLDPLRNDPRFKDLLRVRGLEGRRPIRSTPSVGETP